MPISPGVLPIRGKHHFQQRNYLFLEHFTLFEAAQNTVRWDPLRSNAGEYSTTLITFSQQGSFLHIPRSPVL